MNLLKKILPFLFVCLAIAYIYYGYNKIYTCLKIYKNSEEQQQRGIIYDRNKEILAVSIPTYNIVLDAGLIQDINVIKDFLSKYNINLSTENYKAIKEKKKYILIKKDLPEKIIVEMKNELEETKKDKYGCLIFEIKYKRIYSEKKLAAHVIGRVNSENIGISGIESTCNKQLIGEKYKKIIKNILLNSSFEEAMKFPTDVVLTIDKQLQLIVEEELDRGLKETKSKRGVAIIQNPYNGEILAMASLPTYNPEEKISDIDSLTNRAVSFSVEPGSIFKIVILSTVLNEGIFKLTDKVYCENGNFKIYGTTIHDHYKQKTITVQQILEQSSNIGTSKLALKVDNKTFYKYITNFGFYSKTGIELTGEEKGLLAPVNRWSKISPCLLSFGQEIYFTPIQTIGAYSVIANGGTLLKPKIIKSIGDKECNEPEIVRKNVISEDTAYKVRQVLRGVVVNGTGKSAKVSGYSVGGKTGTAQKFDQELKRYSKKNYMASFCGILPAMNPEIVILVIYDEPNGDVYYASTVAASVFSKIAQRTAEYLNIKTDIF